MGYRSTVAIYIGRVDGEAPSIPEALALAKTKGVISHDYFEKGWNSDSYGWDDDKFYFYQDWVKWYDSFEDVKAMEDLYRFFEEMGDESGAYQGKFCRLGEEDDDVEDKAFGDAPWDYMFIKRSIEFDTDLLGNQAKQEEPQTN